MSFKKLTVVEIIGVLHISCGVVLGDIKSLKALVIVNDLVVILDGKAHGNKHFLNLAGSKCNWEIRADLVS